VYSAGRIGGIGQVTDRARSSQGKVPTWPAGPAARRGAFWIPGVLAAVSVGVSAGLALAEATGHQIDFDIYRMGAGHVFGNDLYTVRLSRALMGGSPGMRFTYPPFAALLFVPFSWLPVRAGQVTWSLLNLAALFAVAVLSIRTARPQWSRRTACGIAALALLPVLRLNPAALTLALGQVNIVIVLLVLADLTCVFRVGSLRRRGSRWVVSPADSSLPRGIGVGIAAAVKLTPLIFIPFLLLTRQFRAAATAFGTFLLCSLGTLAVAPHSSWLYWSTEIFDDRRSGNLRYISDQNLASALQRFAGGPVAPLLTGLLAALIACGGLALAAWAYRTSSSLLAITVCAATGLIISPVSWVHHYVWVVPLLAWLALASDRPRGGRWWALGLAALLWAAPVWWVPDPQTGYGGPLVLLAGNSFFLAMVAFVVLTAAMLARRARSPRRAADRSRLSDPPSRIAV
jgi:alpha-1,2-mannosyltransferase